MSYDTHWDQFSKFYPKTPNKKQILSDWIKKKKGLTYCHLWEMI